MKDIFFNYLSETIYCLNFRYSSALYFCPSDRIIGIIWFTPCNTSSYQTICHLPPNNFFSCHEMTRKSGFSLVKNLETSSVELVIFLRDGRKIK